MTDVSVETTEFAARDGFKLQASIFTPAGDVCSTVVVLPGMAVHRRFYAAFARHLAGLGRRVVTFDYRGIGGSRPARLRGFPATMLDWADLDAWGVCAGVTKTWPGQPLHVVGHSYGGQAYGLAPHPAVTCMVGIAAQSGDMRLFDREMARQVRWLARYAAPVAIPLFGYFPAGRIGGGGEDVPAGVYRQWGRWCLTPGYFFGDPAVHAGERFAEARARVHLIGFADDCYAPPAAVEALAQCFPGRLESLEIMPAAMTASSRSRHFDCFRAGLAEPLWDAVDAHLG